MSMAGAVLQLVVKGGPFRVANVRVPLPDVDEVVVKLKALALNPLDWKQMASDMMIKSSPAVLGLEASGIVEAFGTDIRYVKRGDAVMARCTARGRAAAYQKDYAAVKKRNIALKPEDLTFEDASSLPYDNTS